MLAVTEPLRGELMTNCPRCGCRLASDHTGKLCTPCTRAGRNDVRDIPAPPPGFWDREDVREAVAAQHLGRVIRAYRFAFTPPINQADMAEWLGVGQSQVSRIEGGHPPSNLSKLQRWARVLRLPQPMLWFRLPDDAQDASPTPTLVHRLTPQPQRDQGEDDVHRRDALKLAGAAILSTTPWQRLTDTLNQGRTPDQATVRLMEDRTTEFFQLEETTPARTILASLSEHGQTLRRLLEVTRNDQDRQRLLSAAGETEALAGWLAFDLSRPREAATRYRRALAMASEAGDGPLTACTLNYWSYLLASQEKSHEAVQFLADARNHVRGSAATTQAWVSARQAEEAARIGDRETAERALEQAFTAYDYARPHSERSWTRFFGASRLGSLAVSSYGRLGHRETDTLATSLLASLSPTETKVRALVIADLALSATRRADIDRADGLANEALPLAIRTEASLAQDRLWELTEALPQHNGKGTAEALRQRVTSGLLATSQA
jgi:transcriptional regulator with XRE-family HTH domain